MREKELLGVSPAMIDLRAEVDRVARSEAKVLITGESGSGKELVAATIHAGSPRAAGPMHAVNCGGLSESLLESELFGHVRGSFTGAYRDKPGKLELADRGTMFLDEVGEMTLHMQGLLLRFLETGELQKVGATGAVARVDVRVIAATNRSLREMITQGTFREDLFYRLNVIHLHVPPLRERREDIPLLVNHFLAHLNRPNGSGPPNGSASPNGSAAHNDAPVQSVSSDAMQLLVAYPWPGNVRELVNVVERLLVTSRQAAAGVEDLPPEIRSASPGSNRPKRERRRTVADDLFKKLVEERESFWTTVYPMYMQREITKGHVRDVVRKGLEEARGNYKIVARLFNMEQREYKRFLNFLRKHDCQVPFRDYR